MDTDGDSKCNGINGSEEGEINSQEKESSFETDSEATSSPTSENEEKESEGMNTVERGAADQPKESEFRESGISQVDVTSSDTSINPLKDFNSKEQQSRFSVSPDHVEIGSSGCQLCVLSQLSEFVFEELMKIQEEDVHGSICKPCLYLLEVVIFSMLNQTEKDEN